MVSLHEICRPIRLTVRVEKTLIPQLSSTLVWMLSEASDVVRSDPIEARALVNTSSAALSTTSIAYRRLIICSTKLLNPLR